MKVVEAVTLLAALAQETRLSIYRLLVEAGPDGFSAGHIGEQLRVPAATLSFHLKELAHAGLITARHDKQFVYYAADYERMAELMTFLTQNCCKGMSRACLSVVETELARCCSPQPKTKPRRRSA